MQKNLTIIDNVETLNPLTIFTAEGADKLIEEIKERIVDFDADVQTEDGRDLIKTSAFQVSKVKNAIDKKRIALVADEKAKLKAIDIAGGKIWDFLESQQERIRKPLDEYEAKEEKRIQDREDRIKAITDLKILAAMTSDVEKLSNLTQQAKDLYVFEWEEFTARAMQIYESVLPYIENKLATEKQAVIDRKELEELRKKEDERKQKERDDKIREEAAEATRKKIAEETAEAERKLAEEVAKKVEVVAPIVTETKPVIYDAVIMPTIGSASISATGKIALSIPTDQNKAKMNNEILSALVKVGLSQAAGKIVIKAIVQKQVPYTTINYEA